jgi:hypothetical protein
MSRLEAVDPALEDDRTIAEDFIGAVGRKNPVVLPTGAADHRRQDN